MPDTDGPSLSAALAAHRLLPRGGLVFGEGDAAPAGPSGAPARAVVLVGHAGASIWPHVEAWRATQPKDIADPLDSWSRIVIGRVAAAFGARAVSPSDRPFLPFQHWAMRAEGLKPSPLGILMHPVYGLWHAWRGALLFDDTVELDALHASNQDAAAPIHLCDLCVGKPCLKACPIGAHAADGFDYPACLSHVRSPAGAACMGQGCFDRNACPHGTAYRYPAAAQAFHMASFARGADPR